MSSPEIIATEVVKTSWSNYDKTIANCHLSNYGVIFLDKYGSPIDNEYEVEALYQKLQEVKA